MRTTKPISTISYNTQIFLDMKLQELLKNKIIVFYAYIKHYPEDDEGGKKEHYHLYIEPSKMLQTEDLREQFKELDLHNQDKPLSVLPFQSSKFEHWYMYILHDTRYLASKGQSRKYHYSHSDIVASDYNNLNYLSKSIDMLKLSPYSSMLDAQKQGLSWQEYFMRGGIPIQQLNLFEKAWYLLLREDTYRNGRQGHL